MSRKFMALLLTLGSVIAIAQDGQQVIEGARTAGIAVNGARAEFHAARVKNREGREVVNGESKFNLPPARGRRAVRIEIRVADIGTDKTKARFGGKAVLHTVDANGRPMRVQGKAFVMVNDLHKPDGQDRMKDAYSIHFDDGAGHTFNFEGAVDRGDLVVKPKA